MSYIGQTLPADTFQGFTTDSFAGDGSATTFTLSKTPFNESALLVVINNVVQKPTTNFTVSGTTLTIVGTAVASGDVIYATHIGGALPIGQAASLDLNGASDQLILDADADTTISADTDDQIDFKLGGVDEMTMSSSGIVINEGSNDRDFRIETNTYTHCLFIDGGNDNVFINKSSATANWFNGNSIVPSVEIFGTANTSNRMTALTYGSADAGAAILAMGKSRSATPDNYTIIQDDDQMGIISFQGTDGTHFLEGASIRADVDGTPGANDMPGRLEFHTTADGADSGSERMRLDALGALMIGKTALNVNVEGIEIRGATAHNLISVCTAANTGLYIARNTNDGTMVALYAQGALEGSISVSGSTVTYGQFTGGHWSRLADNSKPTILRGTIVETLDEMCDWYQAVADVAEVKYTAEDQEVIDGNKNVGDVKEKAYTVKESISLGDKSVGDTITFTYSSNGKEYTGTIVKEDDVKHTKCKISDTADSKKVYGVFSNWDDADDGSDGDVNDMNIAQVGTYIIRVHKDVTVEAGDLLVSNGDGTAKVQDDDIIRSKTVAKVNSNIKVETYSDGSYTVPCTLHC